MKTIDAVYSAWQRNFWDHEDPEEIEEAYRYFRITIRNLDQKTAERIWDAMTICQQKAAENAFKEGFRMGFNLRDEL